MEAGKKHQSVCSGGCTVVSCSSLVTPPCWCQILCRFEDVKNWDWLSWNLPNFWRVSDDLVLHCALPAVLGFKFLPQIPAKTLSKSSSGTAAPRGDTTTTEHSTVYGRWSKGCSRSCSCYTYHKDQTSILSCKVHRKGDDYVAHLQGRPGPDVSKGQIFTSNHDMYFPSVQYLDPS